MKISLITYLIPLFFTLFDVKTEPRKTEAFQVYLKDSLLHQVELVYDDQNLPDQYYCLVRTPVCDDGLCKMVILNVYWDLLGNFSDFETPEGRPLTKFDHLEFTREDYLKLRDILKDKNSLLKDYEVEELIDENTQLVSDSVDATTGATKETVKKAVVSGAVYSTYTIWHVVNGKITEKIKDHTSDLINEDLIRKFLVSGNHNYQYFAIDEILKEQKTEAYMPEILELIKNANAFVARYAIDKLPLSIWNDEEWQVTLVNLYPSLNYTAQQSILTNLEQLNLNSQSLLILSGQLENVSEKQLDQILSLITNNKSAIPEGVVDQLAGLPYHYNPAFARKGYETLKSLDINSKSAKEAIKFYENNK